MNKYKQSKYLIQYHLSLKRQQKSSDHADAVDTIMVTPHTHTKTSINLLYTYEHTVHIL